MTFKKKNYHHGDLRGQLLEAVRALIEESGLDGFSIAEACRRAGVSTAAPYKHFTDRHDIIRGVVLLAMERLRLAMRAAADAHAPDAPARVAAIGQAYVDFARAEPGMFGAMFGLAETHGGDDAEMTACGDATFGIVVEVVADRLNRSVDDADAKARAYALWCFVHGHSFLVLDAKMPPDGAHPAEDVLLRMIGDAMLTPR
ncbi:TetR/AcrR family transcriptional regulator [Jannaschia donghaensis]|nr:TetR/AcrR family transcriptional regulator [Jannaschia donghaensis]